MSKVLHLNKEELELAINNGETLFIDFYADWCGPCKMLAPSIEELANNHEEVKVVKINVDNEPALAMQYQVQSIPTLVTIKNKEVVNRRLGFMSYEDLEAML